MINVPHSVLIQPLVMSESRVGCSNKLPTINPKTPPPAPIFSFSQNSTCTRRSSQRHAELQLVLGAGDTEARRYLQAARWHAQPLLDRGSSRVAIPAGTLGRAHLRSTQAKSSVPCFGLASSATTRKPGRRVWHHCRSKITQ